MFGVEAADWELPSSKMLLKIMGWMRSARQREKFSRGAVRWHLWEELCGFLYAPVLGRIVFGVGASSLPSKGPRS